jgi:hypothetical protein
VVRVVSGALPPEISPAAGPCLTSQPARRRTPPSFLAHSAILQICWFGETETEIELRFHCSSHWLQWSLSKFDASRLWVDVESSDFTAGLHQDLFSISALCARITTDELCR